MIERTLWNIGEYTAKSWICSEAIQFTYCLLDERSAFDFDNRSETWRHEKEVEPFIHLSNLFPMTEFALKIIERVKLAATRPLDFILILKSWITVYRVRNFKVASEDHFRHKTVKLNGCTILVVSTFVIEAEPGNGYIRIKVRKLVLLQLSRHH